MEKMKRKKGQASPEILGIVGIAVICFLVAEGYGFIDVIPGYGKPKGNADVNMGYILEDGTKVPVKPGESATLYGSMDTLTFYESSAKNRKIDGIWFELNVTPKTQNVDSDKNISITTTYKVTAYNPNVSAVDTFSEGSDTKTTIAGSTASLGYIEIGTAKLIKAEGREISYNVSYDVTATVSGTNLSAEDTATASLKVYYNEPEKTLKISTSVNKGYLEIVK